MDDVELVLRFFAYRFLDKFSGTIEDFLDEYLKQANQFSDSTLLELEKIFTQSVEIAYK
jgi:transposase-like protein